MGEVMVGAFVVSVANREEVADVGRLRYCAYRGDGMLVVNGSETFVDGYDWRPGVFSMLVRDGELPVGTLRFSLEIVEDGVFTYDNAPEFGVFADVMPAAMMSGRQRVAVGGRFAIAPECRDRSTVALLLMLAQVRTARAVEADWGLATARGSHLRFYERLLKMTALGVPRRMPGLEHAYDLVYSDMHRNGEACLAGFPRKLTAWFEERCPDWDEEVQRRLANVL